jgi:Protein of unknown function (DUF3800)
MYVYIDESGDLGFSIGSSEFFTIAFVITNNPISFERCIKRVKQKYNIPRDVELKGSSTREQIKKDLLARCAQLDINIYAITVRKKNVASNLRRDTNILYNYVVGLSLVEQILHEHTNAKVFVRIDRRVISITSGFKFDEYLKYKIWYEGKRQDITLDIQHLDSHRDYCIQGIDVICNSIYRKYGSADSHLYDIIRSKVRSEKRLFFDK